MTHRFMRVAVTGGAGHIGYNLLFRIAHGDLFGPDTRIALNILEIPEMVPHLEGIKMELQDCAFPLLQEIKVGSEGEKIFKEADLAILIGSKPRTAGMERRDLLMENAKIFLEQGNALDKVANKECKVLVVGNPCNTNCWIARSRADRLNPDHFYAMMRLDQNRATALIAHKAGVDISDVKNVIIWGNHSSTQVPDYSNATIKGKPVTEVIKDRKWLEDEFVKAVQQRGAEIIKVRGKSSAASAAHAIIDSVKDIYTPTPKGSFYSLAVSSNDSPYDVRENLIFSFPCRTTAEGKVEIVPGLKMPDVEATEKELIEEQSGEIAIMTRM